MAERVQQVGNVLESYTNAHAYTRTHMHTHTHLHTHTHMHTHAHAHTRTHTPAATMNDATWEYAMYPFAEWNTPGGDFLAEPSSSASVTFAQFEYEWPGLAQDVQYWVDNPDQDFGFLLKGKEGAST